MPSTRALKSRHALVKLPLSASSEGSPLITSPLPVTDIPKAAQDLEHSVFPFQKLPPELRNKIYQYVFISDKYISGRTKSGSMPLTRDFKRASREYLNLGFLLSCRQVYHEAANIFYTENGFEFSYNAVLHNFLKGLGKEKRQLITKLRSSYTGKRMKRTLQLIQECDKLEVLDIHMGTTWISWHTALIINTLQVLRGELEVKDLRVGKVVRITRGVAHQTSMSASNWYAFEQIFAWFLDELPKPPKKKRTVPSIEPAAQAT